MKKILFLLLFIIAAVFTFAEEKNIVILVIEDAVPAEESGLKGELFNIMKSSGSNFFVSYLRDDSEEAELILKGNMEAIRKHAAQYKADIMLLCVNKSSKSRQMIYGGKKMQLFTADSHVSLVVLDVTTGKTLYSIANPEERLFGNGGTAETAEKSARKAGKEYILTEVKTHFKEIAAVLTGMDEE